MNTLEHTLKIIRPVDHSITPAIQAHLDDLTKPQGSLGRLEEIAMRYALATGTVKPKPGKCRIYCFAGDHGVAAEGVSAFPKEVTPQMVFNMLAGGAAVNVFARHAGAELNVVDMGVDADFANAPHLLHHKVARGTANMAIGPAMTKAQTIQALETGIALATQAASEGITLLGTGEMGIANTTPATALFAAYLDLKPSSITGRGTGVDDARLQHKISVIEKSIAINKDSLTEPLSILAALGGFEIAGIAGLVLGGAANRVPVVVDGFISTAGALAAIKLQPAAADYVFFSHLSEEAGHRIVMNAIGVKPILDLNMRLGEGTGGALAMTIIQAALKMMAEMATFSSAQVSGKEGS
ncbi:MAG: nicotinate-nucleotide--dimethylbenzimidazole phosphoribosyltransferase [bacterium]